MFFINFAGDPVSYGEVSGLASINAEIDHYERFLHLCLPSLSMALASPLFRLKSCD